MKSEIVKYEVHKPDNVVNLAGQNQKLTLYLHSFARQNEMQNLSMQKQRLNGVCTNKAVVEILSCEALATFTFYRFTAACRDLLLSISVCG